MADLIERAKAVAERLDVGTVIFREPDNFATYTDTDGKQLRVNLGGSVVTQQTLGGPETAAIIRELIVENDALGRSLRTAASCLEQCAEGVATQNDMQTWADDALKALEGTQHG